MAASTASTSRRNYSEAITKFWSFAAPAYDLPHCSAGSTVPRRMRCSPCSATTSRARIADIACGTGILADRIERELHPDKVFGVDMSEGMLKEAKARSTAVQWLTGPAEQLPFDDGALDAVVTTSAFHFFDQPAALAEFYRVLAPGGFAVAATISPRQPFLIATPGRSALAPAHNPSPEGMRELFDGRRVHRRRSAPGPAPGVDAVDVGSHHGRRQGLVKAWLTRSTWRLPLGCPRIRPVGGQDGLSTSRDSRVRHAVWPLS